MNMVVAIILVPVRDNDGNPFPTAYWEELGSQFRGRFGGYTRTPGSEGEWVDEGRVYRDQTVAYTVGLASWRQVADFIEVADWTRSRFRQLAVWIQIGGMAEILEGA